MSVYAVIYNDGNLLPQHFKHECHKDGWVPLIVLREQNGNTTLPLFYTKDVAHKFMKRNLPSNVTKGILILKDEDEAELRKKGWDIRFFAWPNKFVDHPKYKIDLEIVEIDELGYETYR